MYARLRCGGNLPLCLAFGTGDGHLWYGICAPCSKRLPGVRDTFSKARRTAPATLNAFSKARRTADSTDCGQPLPHRTHLQCAKRPPLGGD